MAALQVLNQYLSSSYTISAATVISTAKTNLYDKTFMGAVAHDVPLLTGQLLLHEKC